VGSFADLNLKTYDLSLSDKSSMWPFKKKITVPELIDALLRLVRVFDAEKEGFCETLGLDANEPLIRDEILLLKVSAIDLAITSALGNSERAENIRGNFFVTLGLDSFGEEISSKLYNRTDAYAETLKSSFANNETMSFEEKKEKALTNIGVLFGEFLGDESIGVVTAGVSTFSLTHQYAKERIEHLITNFNLVLNED